MTSIFLPLVFATNLFAAEIKSEIKGVAKKMDGKTIVYLEKHSVILDENGYNKILNTEYSKPDGTVFAKITSDFSKNKTIPEVVFNDTRFDTKEELNFVEDNKFIVFKVTKKGKVNEKKFKVEDNMVVGQGFDNFVKINFKKLSEDNIQILFGLIGKLDFFNFGSKKISSTEDKSTFGIKIKNVFLKMFVDELKVEYDTKTKQLTKFTGLSNITDDKNSQQDVIIDYEKVN